MSTNTGLDGVPTDSDEFAQRVSEQLELKDRTVERLRAELQQNPDWVTDRTPQGARAGIGQNIRDDFDNEGVDQFPLNGYSPYSERSAKSTKSTPRRSPMAGHSAMTPGSVRIGRECGLIGIFHTSYYVMLLFFSFQNLLYMA